MRKLAALSMIGLLLMACAAFQQSSGVPAMGSTWQGAAASGPAVVQAKNCDCKNTSTHCIINTVGSAQCNNTPTLTTVTTSHLVMTFCGSDVNANCVATGPVSTPTATWTQLASNTTQDQVWYTCSSGAFTAIDFGPFSQQDAIVEFSGVNTSLCNDRNPAMKAQNTTTWSTNASGTTAQAHELVVGWLSQFSAAPGYACGGGFTQVLLANGTSSSLIICDAVETSIGSFTVTGTVATAVASQEAGVYTFEYP